MKFTMGVKLGVKVRQLETMKMLSWANHIQHPQVPYIFGISMTRRVCLQNVNVLGLPHVVQEPQVLGGHVPDPDPPVGLRATCCTFLELA